MKEWRAEWDTVETKLKTVISDCQHFGISPPEFEHYAEITSELVEQEEAWKLYERFNEELSAMGKEDWLSFSRGKGMF